MSILHKLEWGYQTQKFDSKKIIPEEHITELLNAMNLTMSPFDLQPYNFIVVHDSLLQQKLSTASHNRNQITEASHLVVILSVKEVSASYIKNYIQRVMETRKQAYESLRDLEDFLLSFFKKKSPSEQVAWNQKQSHLPLGTLLVAAADLKIDTYYLESFDVQEYDKLLAVDDKNITTNAVIALGYRDLKDKSQYMKKVYRSLDDIVGLRYGK